MVTKIDIAPTTVIDGNGRLRMAGVPVVTSLCPRLPFRSVLSLGGGTGNAPLILGEAESRPKGNLTAVGRDVRGGQVELRPYPAPGGAAVRLSQRSRRRATNSGSQPAEGRYTHALVIDSRVREWTDGDRPEACGKASSLPARSALARRAPNPANVGPRL